MGCLCPENVRTESLLRWWKPKGVSPCGGGDFGGQSTPLGEFLSPFSGFVYSGPSGVPEFQKAQLQCEAEKRAEEELSTKAHREGESREPRR
jgi:hypothetical protein